MNRPRQGIAPRMFVAIISLASIVSSISVAHAFKIAGQQDLEILLPEGTAVKVVTAQEISSKTANAGDVLKFKVDEDVLVNEKVIISKGTPAKGSVINAEPSGHMGKSGKLGIVVESTTTVDGQPLKLRAAKGKEGKDKTNSTAALSVLVSGFFLLKKGSEAKIAEGTPVTVYVAEEKRFRVDGSSLVAVPLSPNVERPAVDTPATVYIYRPSKMVGKALEPSVFVDDIELARMDNGRYFTLKLKPGKHIVHMTNEKKGFAIDMGPGQTYYFRVGIEMGMWKGRGKLTLEDPEKALPEIKKLKFLGADKIKDHTLVVELQPDQPKP
jgi:hypothetical protein